jgi:ABC-type dipeptide/oligopeptide/nickel transport system ATPase subunit
MTYKQLLSQPIRIDVRNLSQPGLFQHLSFSVTEHERLGIFGMSGCGKTTLLKILLGIIQPYAGQILWNQIEVGKLIRHPPTLALFKIGIVMQNAAAALNPRLSVYESLLESLTAQITNEIHVKNEMKECLHHLWLPIDILTCYPRQLSGGQLQRVQLLRALIMKPRVLFLDEPLSQLDHKTKSHVADWLHHRIQQLQCTTVVISHDHNWLGQFVNQIIYLSNENFK